MSEGARTKGSGAVAARWHEFRRGWKEAAAEVIQEALVTIYVNGEELATIMATPRDLGWLALGFLWNERLIQSYGEVALVHVNQTSCCVDVWLNHGFQKPRRAIITSGCGGGLTFDDPSVGVRPLEEEVRIAPWSLHAIFNRLHFPESLYARARGVHAAGLTDGSDLLVVTEDIGRHNTIDKLTGACLERGIETRGRILLATGRVSSEMLRKGALMRCPVIASRNSPTSLSVAMAEAWNITLIGYVRRDSMRVYTHPRRLGYDEPAVLPLAGD